MATLREEIQSKIETNQSDPAMAAIEVCKLLEKEIGLAGNGWFDGDPVMEKELNL